jgi:circadian clock protein KaiA
MLIPILILQPHVKKCLNNLSGLTKQHSLSGWMRKFIYPITTQLHYLPVAANAPVKINYLPKQLQQNLFKQFPDQYCYVFACYKPKNQQPFQEMTPGAQQALLQQLKLDYSQIILDYFTTDKTLKEKIDKFINTVFYANIPVPQIIEIHMELIDEFSKQLKLEGRSDETLLDYRLTLIDILANLCEVYRCSIYK